MDQLIIKEVIKDTDERPDEEVASAGPSVGLEWVSLPVGGCVHQPGSH